MQVDIELYLDGTAEERLPKLTTTNSPLRLGKRTMNSYILYSRDPVLDSFFVYGNPDSESMSEDPLHVEVQKSLDFHPESNLHYGGCNLNLEKIAVFRKIMEHSIANGISVYMTARDEYGKEILIRGYNSITNVGIENSNFKQTFPDILE